MLMVQSDILIQIFFYCHTLNINYLLLNFLYLFISNNIPRHSKIPLQNTLIKDIPAEGNSVSLLFNLIYLTEFCKTYPANPC